MELTPDEIAFLAKHNVPLDRVFDASGLQKSVYKELMRIDGYWVHYGSTRCKAAGHRLRTSAGCIVCNTAYIKFARQWYEQAEIYIAHSSTLGVIKIGVAKSAEERLRSLVSHGYGGASDWNIVFSVLCDDAGKTEAEIHSALSDSLLPLDFWKGGVVVTSKETFDCSIPYAINMVKCFVQSN